MKKLLEKFKKKPNVFSAIKNIVPKDLLDSDLSSVEDMLILEEVASRCNFDINNLLEQTADILNLSPLFELPCPTPQLIREIGIPAIELRNKGLCPILLESTLCMAICTPRSLETYQAPAAAYLTTYSRVEAAWLEYFSQIEEELDTKVIHDLVKTLALEAKDNGANELLIGVPDNSSYEYSGQSGTYRGDIDSRVHTSLIKMLEGSQKEYIPSNDPKHLAISCINGHSIVYVSWEQVTKNTTAKVTRACLSDILLVEDDHNFSALVTRLLQSKGLSVHTASNGQEALDILKTQAPKLVVSDIHMPRMDGVTLLTKAQATYPSLPFLMLTSDDDPLMEAQLAQLGAWAFVKKQESPQVLMSWIHNCLSRLEDDDRQLAL